MRRLAPLLVILLAAACDSSAERVVVAAGTTVVDSGLIDRVADAFEEQHAGIELSIVGAATAEVLALGDRGAADVLITHAPEAEEGFLAAHPAAEAALAMESSFVLVGPGAAVGPLASLDLAEAFAAIAAGPLPFVSRGDGSGTHTRERRLWELAGVDPQGQPWFDETGQGMGFTLQVTDQRSALTLAEQGAYLATSGVVTLVPAQLRPSELEVNPYRVIAVQPAAVPAAGLFSEWLVSPAGKQAIVQANMALFGEVIYSPGD